MVLPRNRATAVARRHGRTVVRCVVAGVLLGYVAWRVPSLAGQLAQVERQPEHLRWGWVAVAGLSGIGALVVYGEVHRQLLLVGGARLPVMTVQGINFVENAVSTTVPVVGGAGSLGYAISQLRRRGVDTALASWSVFVAGVIASLTLLVLGVLGLGWAGWMPVSLALAAATVLILGAVGFWTVLTHPAVLGRGLRPLFKVAHRIPGPCHRCRRTWELEPDRVARRVSARVALLQPHGARWLVLITLAALSWMLDFLTLMAGSLAVGAAVPWSALVVGFLIVQGSIALQILPGGAGLAETGLLGALLAGGAAPASAAATVLVYRSVTWLGPSLLGWLIFALQLRTSPARTHEHTPEVAQPAEPALVPRGSAAA